MRAWILTIIIFTMLASTSTYAAATSYYADLQFSIDNSGKATVSGRTNFEGLKPGVYDTLTSKSGAYWLLNISPDAEFSEYIFSAQLPQNSKINYVKASSPFRIESVGDRLEVTVLGNSEKPYLLVQYSLENKRENNIILETALGLILVLAMITIIMLIIKKRRNFPAQTTENHKAENNSDMTEKIKKLPVRQAQIMKIIFKSGGSATQARIMQELKIPKSSLSRNIQALISKGLVQKDRYGMTNLLSIKREKEH
ncbi:MAG: MarR family transcriptional regulator [Candidatus Woesearchaeota archaeon]